MNRKGGRNRSQSRREGKKPSRRVADSEMPAPGKPPSIVNLPGRIAIKHWLFAAVLLTAVFLVYRPAWNGGFVWDDDQHVTSPELRTWRGLGRIWFDVYATQQYYPLLHSAFWIEHKLWGDAPLGYHLVNILLHGVAAILVAAILRRLAVPGAYLAAAIFALHPVHVESVAWITELKNTLSAVFYLAAAMAYLRFDQSRSRRVYIIALALFIAGLLSKTVTATLPGAMLVIFWWQRGRLSWRKDILPLVPFFALGAIAGAFTAWVEWSLIGAQGKPFAIGFMERGLLAGRVIWFYLGKLIWPTHLLFIYPRWTVSAAVWWQYLFPAGVMALVTACWVLRRRSRGPLAAVLFFIGTLFPVLGFCNVYPFIFSFVADHFQYLASLGVIALASAGIAIALSRRRLWDRPAGYAACLALLAPLAILTWRQCAKYADAETLWRATIERNPQCWMAYNNLGVMLSARNRTIEAIECYQEAIRIKPDHANAQFNLGNTLAKRGDMAAAEEHFCRALQFNPSLAVAHIGLGNVLAKRGRLDEAADHYNTAIDLGARDAGAHNALGNAAIRQGQIADALGHFTAALEIQPDYAEALSNLGNAEAARGRLDEAVDKYREALRIKPDEAAMHVNLGNALMSQGKEAEAVGHYRTALELRPDSATAHNSLGAVLARHGRIDDALVQFEEAVKHRPDLPEAHQNLGNALATQGRFSEAAIHLREALKLGAQQAQTMHKLPYRATPPAMRDERQ